MDTANLFTAALQLQEPWYVTKVEFTPSPEDVAKLELHIHISFRRGAYFNVTNEDGELLLDENGKPRRFTAHDSVERTWRHLDFFQHKTYIHARVPRVSTEDGGCLSVSVPWARKYSGFTLLFESWVVELAKNVPVAVIGKLVHEHDTRIWRILRYYIDEARSRVDASDVTAIGMDETSRKGHKYITVMVDLKTHNVLYVVDGKDSATVDAFVADFKAHGGDPNRIRVVTCDMSLGFKKGIDQNFPNSVTVIDKFHVIKHANEAVDEVRKQEAKENPLLQGTKYIWLKNPGNLTDKQRKKQEKLSKKHLKVARAYSMRLELQDIYNECKTREDAESRLRKLCSWMSRCRLEPMKNLRNMLVGHWESILNYFEFRYTNAILEGTNNVIQNIKARARGFRNVEYFKRMIYLVCGGLDLDAIVEDLQAQAWS